jgi:hypothetical protein
VVTRAESARALAPEEGRTVIARVLPAAAPALLAFASAVMYVAAAPNAPREALRLHLGALAAAGHFSIGWLGALVLHAGNAFAGYAGMTVLGAFGLYALTAFVYVRARTRAGGTLALGAALFALVACFDTARVGGDAPGWLGAAAFLYVLDRAPRRSAWLAQLIALVWCNVSPTGVAAPLLAVLVAFGRAAGARDVTAARPIWPLAFASAVATLLTPAGLAYPAGAAALLHLDESFARVLPIAPATAAPHVFRLVATLVVMAAMWLWAGRPRAADAPLVLAAFVLCFFDGNFTPLLGIVAGPAFAAAAADGARPAPLRRAESFFVWCAAACFAFTAGMVVPHWSGRATGPPDPHAMLERLSARGGGHVVFCSVVAWCDYAEALPGMHPLLSERVDLASPDVLQAQEKIARVREGWHDAVRANHIDVIVAQKTSALAQLAGAMPGWKSVDDDADARVFVRDGAAR